MPSRRVIEGDALPWLAAEVAPDGASVFTSLPDVSELPDLDLEAWRRWFVETVARVASWVPEGGAALFYQTDVRRRGLWVDKAHLVSCGVEKAGKEILWHKIVCRETVALATTKVSQGRAAYAHLLAAGAPELGGAAFRGGFPDVLEGGEARWSRGMGDAVCLQGCRFLQGLGTRVVVDPFCGQGAVLAAANALGMDALGVELSPRRCRAARKA